MTTENVTIGFVIEESNYSQECTICGVRQRDMKMYRANSLLVICDQCMGKLRIDD